LVSSNRGQFTVLNGDAKIKGGRPIFTNIRKYYVLTPV
jgi:hypothetical protein